MPLDWPLVGRQEELTFIREALETPGNNGVVLAGEAGVGKTRLATEALALAGSGAAVATEWAVGTAAASFIPFGAVAHLLPAAPSAAPGPPNLWE